MKITELCIFLQNLYCLNFDNIYRRPKLNDVVNANVFTPYSVVKN